jgi:oligosaccharide repeat unit polymerase
MFEALLWTGIVILAIALFAALDGSRDVFHPLVFIAPMMAFIYGWMPLRLLASDGLARFFDTSQLLYVHALTLAGITAFVIACLAAGVKIVRPATPQVLSSQSCHRLRIGGAIVGGIGLICWLISIVNVGGFVNAFSKSYSGGWDDSGYVRDGSLLMLVGVLLLVSAVASEGPKVVNLILLALFAGPWTAQALLTARRGPTFAIIVVIAMGWYLSRNRRPPAIAALATGLLLGWLVLFLVANRGSIYLGSDFDVKTDVAGGVSKSDTGNEYIYGAGAILSTERRGHYFWMRRYLAQLLVRPIPSAIWPTKYEDFGVPELLHNAGTGEGFVDALGWEGAPGSAPGIVADLFIEVWWLAVPLMALLGWCYGWVWRRAVTGGPAWASQYAILSALSIYLVMQTMEAVIFRTLLLSIPCWIVWKWALPRRNEHMQLMRVVRIPTPESVSRA